MNLELKYNFDSLHYFRYLQFIPISASIVHTWSRHLTLALKESQHKELLAMGRAIKCLLASSALLREQESRNLVDWRVCQWTICVTFRWGGSTSSRSDERKWNCAKILPISAKWQTFTSSGLGCNWLGLTRIKLKSTFYSSWNVLSVLSHQN